MTTTKHHAGRTCVAPAEDAPASVESVLCGEPATETRTVSGLDCPLCARCAEEYDRSRVRRPRRRTLPPTQLN